MHATEVAELLASRRVEDRIRAVGLTERLPDAARRELLLRALALPISESPGRFRLLLTRDASIQPEPRARLDELERTVARSLISLVERGMAEGLFRRCEPRTAAFAVLGYCRRLST